MEPVPKKRCQGQPGYCYSPTPAELQPAPCFLLGLSFASRRLEGRKMFSSFLSSLSAWRNWGTDPFFPPVQVVPRTREARWEPRVFCSPFSAAASQHGMGSQAGRDFCSSLRHANPGNLFPCRELEGEEEIDGEGTPTGTQGEGGVQVPQEKMRRWGGGVVQ